MLRAAKVASTGMLLILLTVGISGPRPSPLPVIAAGDDKTPAAAPENEVKKTQRALRDKKHYGGKVDGSFGLDPSWHSRVSKGRDFTYHRTNRYPDCSRTRSQA
jgi:hypothetical protein